MRSDILNQIGPDMISEWNKDQKSRRIIKMEFVLIRKQLRIYTREGIYFVFNIILSRRNMLA